MHFNQFTWNMIEQKAHTLHQLQLYSNQTVIMIKNNSLEMIDLFTNLWGPNPQAMKQGLDYSSTKEKDCKHEVQHRNEGLWTTHW